MVIETLWIKGQKDDLLLPSGQSYRLTYTVPNLPILRDILKANIRAQVWGKYYYEFEGQTFKVLGVSESNNQVRIDVGLVGSPGIVVAALALACLTVIGGGLLANLALNKVERILTVSPLLNIPLILGMVAAVMFFYWFIFKRKAET